MNNNLDDILFKYQTERVKLKKSADNPFFKSKYIPLNDILDYMIPKLTEDGVLCYHKIYNSEIITTLKHIESGETRESSFPLNAKDPQKQGSEITYGKRYNLSCLFNIQDTEDDDANIASSEGNTKEFYAKEKFAQKNYEGFLKKKDTFADAEDAIAKIKSKYELDSHFEEQIKLVYN